MTCEECPTEIVQPTVGRRRRFCSLRCTQARDRRARLGIKAGRVCTECGRQVPDRRRADSETCSEHCARQSRYRKQGHQAVADALQRFWSRVRSNGISNCWEWTGARLRSGYGSFRDGRAHVAHRYSYEYLVAPIPGGLQLDHLCRNRACVNPEHLDPVTQQENLRRARAYQENQ